MKESKAGPIEEFLTARQVAAWLNVSPGTILDWAEARKIPSFKLNGSRRFLPSEIQAWVSERRAA